MLCIGTWSAAVWGKIPVHIGGLFPLSGGWISSSGDRCLQSALLAIKHVNNHTGLLRDYELILDYNDTKVRSLTLSKLILLQKLSSGSMILLTIILKSRMVLQDI